METNSNKQIIVILGMHRSGTSLITKSLEALGVELGDRLMPAAAANNSKGFFEDIDINEFNIELLDFLGSSWHFVEPLYEDDLRVLFDNGYLEKAVELINNKIRSFELFGCKDPRMAKLLPFWIAVFNKCKINVKYIIVIRNPLSVVKSLITRDGLDYNKCYSLWLTHVIPSLNLSKFTQRIVVDYDFFLQNPEVSIEQISSALKLKLIPEKLELFLSDFIDQELRHEVSSREELIADFNCPPLVKDIYLTLIEEIQSEEKHKAELFEQWLSSWSCELARMKSTLALVDNLWVQLNRALYNSNDYKLKLNEANNVLGEIDFKLTEVKKTLTIES